MAVQPTPKNVSTHSDPLKSLQLLLEVPRLLADAHPSSAISHHRATPEPMRDDTLILLRMLLEAPPAFAEPKLSTGDVQHGTGQTRIARDDIKLLQILLEMPPPPSDGCRRPVLLRSIEAYRQLVLGNSLPASWFDTLLLRMQQLLLVGAILAAGYWFVDGPLYDWFHTPHAASVARLNAAGKRVAIAHTAVPITNVPSASSDMVKPTVVEHITMSRHAAARVALTAVSTTNIPSITSDTAKPAVAEDATMTRHAVAEEALTATSISNIPSVTSDIVKPTVDADVTMSRRAVPVVARTATQTPVHLSPVTSEKVNPSVIQDLIVPQQEATVEAMVVPPTPESIQAILPAPSEPTHLLIPSIGVDALVVEVLAIDGEWEIAEYAAGYMHGTARAGEVGNMAISGHLGLRGSVFANLYALEPGADIYVDAGDRRYHYRMRQSQVVWPTQIEVLYPAETPTLTLITCTNWDTQRLIVTADLIDSEPLVIQ